MNANPSGIKSDQTTSFSEVKLNDKLMRMIGIPFLGVLIPHIAGLFNGLSVHDAYYWLGYPYFILLSFAIWHGNRYLMFRTRKRFTWFDRPVEKLILLVINNVFFTPPLTISALCLWYQWTGISSINWELILVVTLINIICVLIVTQIYETVFMLKEQQNEQLYNAYLSRAKAEAELEALKNQIDPHFMFNSLNSLSYLITADAKKASQFTENLAEIYRYILQQKDQDLVLLADELVFTQKYTDLLELRFGKALDVRKSFPEDVERKYMVPPISAFVAMENAIKHNEISEQVPLLVFIDVMEEKLIVRNKIQIKKSIRPSSGIGLNNMNERFKIITGLEIAYSKQNDEFRVEMPLTKIIVRSEIK